MDQNSLLDNRIIKGIKAPHGWTPREDQLEVFPKIEAAFKSGKKIVALQGPTGSGKSLIGVSTALAFNNAYYLVPLKALQDQIEKDFSGSINVFKGKANYICSQMSKFSDIPYRVDESPCQDKDQYHQRKHCREEGLCSYYNALDRAADGHTALMNFTLFLCWMRIRNENPLMSKFTKRHLHIIDEAHRIEDFARDFLTVDLSSDRLEKYLGIKTFPSESCTKDKFVSFLKKVNQHNLKEIASLEKQYGEDLHSVAAEIGSDKLSFHNSLSDKLKAYFENEDNYSFGFEERYNGQVKRNVKYIVSKPLFVGGFIRENILGENTLLLSATLPKKSVNAMGFKDDEFEYIDMPSRFPATNRLIKFTSVGRINKENSDRLIPKMVEKACAVFDRFEHSKGIIHAPSYRVADQFAEALKSTKYNNRILLQSRDMGSAMKILDMHIKSTAPTILLSPGMKEGVDLKNELSRFQIIIKTPYPNLGDPAVKAIAEKDYGWYITRTIVDFMQMYGRSIRSSDDYAETIILDDNMRILLKDYRAWIPKYVMEAVRFS